MISEELEKPRPGAVDIMFVHTPFVQEEAEINVELQTSPELKSEYVIIHVWDPSLTEHFGYFQSNGIPLINASPIGMGLLATAPLQSWHPESDDIKEACAKAVKYCEEEGVDISHLAIKYSASFKEVRMMTFCDG